MNQEDLVARQAMMARLMGTPQPPATQMAQGAQVPPPIPVIPPVNPSPTPNKQLGDMTRKPSEHDTLAKAILPGTAHPDAHIKALSKVLLQKLIPYLGH